MTVQNMEYKVLKNHIIIENQHKKAIFSRTRAAAKVGGCAKYEYDPLNSKGCE